MGCFPTHPVGEGLAPPAGFWKAFILRGGFRPAEVNRRAGQETRPYGVSGKSQQNETTGGASPSPTTFQENNEKIERRTARKMNRPLSSRQVKKEKLRHEGLVPVSKGSQAL